MADFIDLVQERELAERERHINSARRRPVSPSRLLCEACDVTCQEMTELKNKHYRGG